MGSGLAWEPEKVVESVTVALPVAATIAATVAVTEWPSVPGPLSVVVALAEARAEVRPLQSPAVAESAYGAEETVAMRAHSGSESRHPPCPPAPAPRRTLADPLRRESSRWALVRRP